MAKGLTKVISGLLLAFSAVLTAWAGPVDLNSADAETIARELNGIGTTKALAIVAYREKNGAFTTADDLLNVTGIGPQILTANKANILLGSAE